MKCEVFNIYHFKRLILITRTALNKFLIFRYTMCPSMYLLRADEIEVLYNSNILKLKQSADFRGM